MDIYILLSSSFTKAQVHLVSKNSQFISDDIYMLKIR